MLNDLNIEYHLYLDLSLATVFIIENDEAREANLPPKVKVVSAKVVDNYLVVTLV